MAGTSKLAGEIKVHQEKVGPKDIRLEDGTVPEGCFKESGDTTWG
jgi:hypothetical protein